MSSALDPSERCRVCGEHVPLPDGTLVLGDDDTVYFLCDVCVVTPGDATSWW